MCHAQTVRSQPTSARAEALARAPTRNAAARTPLRARPDGRNAETHRFSRYLAITFSQFALLFFHAGGKAGEPFSCKVSLACGFMLACGCSGCNAATACGCGACTCAQDSQMLQRCNRFSRPDTLTSPAAPLLQIARDHPLERILQRAASRPPF